MLVIFRSQRAAGKGTCKNDIVSNAYFSWNHNQVLLPYLCHVPV